MISKYVIAAVVGAGVISGVWFHGNYHGKQSAEAEHQKAVTEAAQRNSALADKVDQLTAKTQQKTREKVRTVYVTKDNDSCVDAPAPGWLLDEIHSEADRSETD